MNQLVSSVKFNPDYFCAGWVYTLCSNRTGKKVNALLSFACETFLSFYTIGDGVCRNIRIGIEHLQTTEIERVIFCLIEFEPADVGTVGASLAPAKAKEDTIHCGECIYI